MLGTHGFQCLFSFVMKNSCLRQYEFWACPNKLHQLDYFVRYAWFTLSVFLCDENFLFDAVRILSWSKYSWSIGLFCEARMICTVCFLLWWKFLLGTVEIFIFFIYSWSIRLQIVLLGIQFSMYVFLSWWKILAQGYWDLSLINWMADCLVWHA